MEAKFKILDYAEKELSLPSPSDNKAHEFEIEIKPLIRFSNEKHVINVQLEVSYLENDNTILNYGVAISFGLIKKEDNIVLTEKETLTELIDVSLGFIRGAMATYTKNSSLRKFILPLINPENLLEKSQIIDLDKK